MAEEKSNNGSKYQVALDMTKYIISSESQRKSIDNIRAYFQEVYAECLKTIIRAENDGYSGK